MKTFWIDIYDSDSGTLKVQPIPDGYYVDVDNIYDLYLHGDRELDDYLAEVHANLVGYE